MLKTFHHLLLGIELPEADSLLDLRLKDLHVYFLVDDRSEIVVIRLLLYRLHTLSMGLCKPREDFTAKVEQSLRVVRGKVTQG